ncbi:MAG: hypothetical protein QOE83_9 [Actinomycetota bacterium]|jgi:anti-anti-sigma regulatory factor|nr:hypothetical protein [Actinomycetota bacterium]
MTQPSFEISVNVPDDVALVSLKGVLDTAGVELFKAHLRSLQGDWTQELIIDLRDLAFIDPVARKADLYASRRLG